MSFDGAGILPFLEHVERIRSCIDSGLFRVERGGEMCIKLGEMKFRRNGMMLTKHQVYVLRDNRLTSESKIDSE